MNFRPAPQSVTCTAAPSACPNNLGLMGGSTRLCHTSADCTAANPNTMFGDCCVTSYNGQPFEFCFSQQYAQIAMNFGVTITCQ
jgi:hypothetical protein